MPYRSDIVLQQLLNENLYLPLKPPVFINNGNEIIISKIVISESYNLTLENKNAGGSIIYTTNGTDPRAIGGANSGSAINGGNSKNIVVAPGTIVKARVKYTTTWSALHEVIFEDSGLFSNLKVTELHYHPTNQDTVDGKQLEFIELKNTGTTTLDLSGLSFTDGISFIFPNGTTLAPKAFVIVASNTGEFNRLYGFSTDYEYSGNLSNGGEQISLETASNQTVFSFTYFDTTPWPTEPDGNGYSLISAEVNPTVDPNMVEYWAVSKYLNGSPMADDEMSVTAVEAITFAKKTDLSIYPNPSSSSVNIDFSLNSNEKTEIDLHDLNGRLLQVLVKEQLSAGDHNQYIQLGDLNLNSGIYLITLTTKNTFAAKKLIYQR
jgi:hypothetical protein